MDTNLGSKRIAIQFFARSWKGRLLTFVGAVIILLLALFFFAIFLAVFAVLSAVVITYIWWVQRRRRRDATKPIVDVEYTVDETRGQQLVKPTPSDSGDDQKIKRGIN